MRRRGLIAVLAAVAAQLRAQQSSYDVVGPSFEVPKEVHLSLDADLRLTVAGKTFLLTQEDIAAELADYQMLDNQFKPEKEG